MGLEDMEVIILGIIGSQGGTDSGNGLETSGLDTDGLDANGSETNGQDNHEMDSDIIGLLGTGLDSGDTISRGDDNIGAAALEARAIAAFHDLNPAIKADEDGAEVVVPADAATLEATRAVFTTALAHLIQSDSVAETITATGETAFRLN